MAMVHLLRPKCTQSWSVLYNCDVICVRRLIMFGGFHNDGPNSGCTFPEGDSNRRGNRHAVGIFVSSSCPFPIANEGKSTQTIWVLHGPSRAQAPWFFNFPSGFGDLCCQCIFRFPYIFAFDSPFDSDFGKSSNQVNRPAITGNDIYRWPDTVLKSEPLVNLVGFAN